MTQSAEPNLKPTQAAAKLVCEADLVIFDFDGVIADSEVISLATLQETLAQFDLSLSLDETRQTFLGRSLKTILDYVALHGTIDVSAFGEVWENTLFDRFAAGLKPVPHVFDVLDMLDRKGTPFCIASSGTHERIGKALAAMDRDGRFEFIFSAEQVARGKPAPDLFEFAARRMGVPPEACLVIEDSPHGVRAASAANMRCIGFTGGQHLADRQAEHADLLRREGAAVVLTSYVGLPELNHIT
jgi:HAD superfamily hydrolase (TIGR01509 family)